MRPFANIKFFFQLLKINIFGATLPLTVIFNVTNRCNCHCKHCYATYPKRDKTGEMSTEEAKQLILDLRNNGCLRMSFAGGEPLIREDIAELINHARRLRLSTNLNSNGILVPDHLGILKHVDSLAISLDGRPEHHDILRGKGTGEKALAGCETAIKAGIKLRINTVINKYNINDIDYILELAKRYKIMVEFNMAISNIFGEGLPPEEFKPTNEELRAALRHIIKRKKEGAPILYSAEAYESVLGCWNDFSVEGVMGVAPEGMPRCPAGVFFCIIDPDGTLWACPHLIGKIKAENALKVGVARAWQVATEHPCRGCYQVYHHEFGRLIGLDIGVLWNYTKTAMGFPV